MKISFKLASVTDIVCDAIAIPIFEEWKKPDSYSVLIDRKSNGIFKELAKEEGFSGKEGETLIVHMRGEIGARRVVALGLGEKKRFTRDTIRKVSGVFARKVQGLKLKKVAMPLIGEGRVGTKNSAQAVCEGSLLGTYSFKKYKTEKSENSFPCELVLIGEDRKRTAQAKKGIRLGEILSKAACFARDLVSEPASALTPRMLAEIAEGVAREGGASCKVFTKKEIEKLGMGGLLGVARGSVEEPRFIFLSYKPRVKARKKIAFVGKGVTFDSGGLSLKTAEAMEKMKDDMAGAATVLGVFSALKEVKPGCEVLGIIAATENMPGGSALKPGDVVRTMDGKTVEVLNTDAEGRLTLADALSFAVKEGADEIIDIATLTKSCAIGLGPSIGGAMGNNSSLLKRILSASIEAGEKFWELPLYEAYRDFIRSDVADMKNSGGREGGALIAGLFLEKFVAGKPWVHIDIAGPSWADKDEPACPKGPSGIGVRTFLTYLASA